MQINPSGSAFGSRRLFSDTTCGLNTAEKKNRQTEHTESYMKGLAQSGKDKDPDADKIREIVDKARMGRKLNQDELNYLREKSPDNYRKIVMAMQEREMLRQQMAAARSRMEAERIYMSHMTSAQKTGDEIVMGQLRGGHDEVVATEEYEDKPLTTEEESALTDEAVEKENKRRRKAKHHAPAGPLVSPGTSATIVGGMIDILK